MVMNVRQSVKFTKMGVQIIYMIWLFYKLQYV